MKNKKNIADALRKLDWIAKLSKKTLPGGLPASPEKTRSLLNRIVLDVRSACEILKQAQFAEGSDVSDKSDMSDERRENKPGLIPTHGGYRNLKSFQVAELVYDGAVIFCNRFVPVKSRTNDQMVQGGRSGRQNIAEGSMASATSKKTEIKLTNVAKSSLEELLLDFEDFLRHRRLRQWEKDDPEALAVRNRYREFPSEWFANRNLSDRSDLSDTSDKKDLLDPYGIADATPETAANTLLCLINQAIYLLKRQIEKLERDFVEEGGFTEKLYRVRSKRKNRQ